MIKFIARDLYETCYFVERRIVGWHEDVCRRWAKANSIRHAHTAKAIVDYISDTHKNVISLFVPDSKQTLFIVAEKTKPKEIPFAI